MIPHDGRTGMDSIRNGRCCVALDGFIPRVLAERGDGPRDVRRTAGAGIPLRALGQHMLESRQDAGDARIYLERIDIKEAFAIELHAGENTVVERAFHDVSVPAGRMQLQHPVREEDKADGRAGFVVAGVVRQIVIVRESLPFCRLADAAGEMHLFACDIVKQLVTGRGERGVAAKSGELGRCGEEVHAADRVPLCLFLLPDRQMLLIIGRIDKIPAPVDPATRGLFLFEELRVLSALPDEIFGQCEVVLIAGHLVHPEQSEFDLLVAGHAVLFALFRSDMPTDAVREPLTDFQERILPGRLKIRDRGLHHMAGAVQLVTFLQILKFMIWLLQNKIGIEIPVLLLRRRDGGNDLIHPRLQRRVRVNGEGIRRALQPFCHIAVLKHHSIKLALLLPGGDAEIGDRVALLGAWHGVAENRFLIGNDYLRDQLLPGCPERICDGDIF